MSKALTGKWILNDKIYPLNAGDVGMIHYVWFNDGFTSNGQRFKAIRFAENILKYETESGLVEAGAGYQEDDYATPYEQYRVIDFGAGSEADDDSNGTFVAWLLSNVTRYGTVADKLVQIAKNEKAVYQSGYDKALEKGGYNQGFEEGKIKGKQAEYDAFWDEFQQNGNRTDYHHGFFGRGWTDKNFNPKWSIIPRGNCTSIFDSSKITDLKAIFDDRNVVLDFSKSTVLSYMLTSSEITRVGVIDTTSCANLNGILYYIPNLVYVEKIILKDDGSQVFTTSFNETANLQDIAFEGVIGNDINFQWSTLLTKASIESIVNHLSDTASGKTLTLSKAAADNAFPCPIEDGNGGWINVGCGGNGEWLELIAPKVENGKWIIDLV